MTVSEYIRSRKHRLEQAGIQCADPLLHMKQIAEHVLGVNTTGLYLRWTEPLSESELRELDAFVERRSRGEPFQYIAGYEWFWNSRFAVGPGVLIPRRETEVLLEELLKRESRDSVRVGELGAGSGNIGISALLERPSWEWHAFERNPDSVPYALKNRDELLPEGSRYHLHEGDFFGKAGGYGPYDWVISNPPYVAREEFGELAREIHHEPEMALDGGAAGMECPRRLIESAVSLLVPGGRLLFEMAPEQEAALGNVLRDLGFVEVESYRDYAGLARGYFARKGEP